MLCTPFKTAAPNKIEQLTIILVKTRPRGYKKISCSTQMSMKFFQLINIKMPTVVGILTFMTRKNSISGLPEPKKAEFLDIFILMSISNFMLS